MWLPCRKGPEHLDRTNVAFDEFADRNASR
jgi:hypothetical protein